MKLKLNPPPKKKLLHDYIYFIYVYNTLNLTFYLLFDIGDFINKISSNGENVDLLDKFWMILNFR